jgi:hypothetical protein
VTVEENGRWEVEETASSSDVETVVTVEENGDWRLEEVDSVCR